MIHIYHGSGKGKTTAAFGLALRAAGRGRRVIIAQFLKSDDTGERRSMEYVPHVLLLPVPQEMKFVSQMDRIERAECEDAMYRLLQDAFTLAEKDSVIILDEVMAALNSGMFFLSDLEEQLDAMPENCEVVLTGRNPPEELLKRADYITEFVEQEHPYRKGITAREGIEY